MFVSCVQYILTTKSPQIMGSGWSVLRDYVQSSPCKFVQNPEGSKMIVLNEYVSCQNITEMLQLKIANKWRYNVHLSKYKCSQGVHAIEILCYAMLHTSIQDNDCLDIFCCRLDWAYWALGFHWQFVNRLRANVASLVGGDWNMTFIFPCIGNVIISIDFHIFQRD